MDHIDKASTNRERRYLINVFFLFSEALISTVWIESIRAMEETNRSRTLRSKM